jgi:O-antigen ligase
MAYGGAAVAIFYPFVGLLIYISFAILRPGVGLWYWSVPQGNYSKVLAVSLLVGWAIRGCGDWRLGRATPVVVSLIGYLAWNVLSATQAAVPAVAWDWVEAQAKVVIPCVVAITLIDSYERIRQLAWVILLSYGYVAYDLNLSYFSGFNRLHELGFGGVDNNCNGIAFVTIIGLGTFLALGVNWWWEAALAGGAVALLAHAVLFSFSRGAMLGLILVGTLSFVLVPKRLKHYALFAGCLLGLALTTGPEVVKRFESAFVGETQRDSSAESRLDMWEICIREATANPVLGLGPHHFPIYAQSFGLTPFKEAHTTWLQVAAEIGVVGAGLLLAYFVIPVVLLWPLTRAANPVGDPFARAVARMVIAATVGFVFTAQFVTIPGLEAPYFVTVLGAGVLKVESAGRAGTGSQTEVRLP